MNKTIKWAGIMGLLFLMAAAFSSCGSSRQLGCPTKITMTGSPVQWPAC